MKNLDRSLGRAMEGLRRGIAELADQPIGRLRGLRRALAFTALSSVFLALLAVAGFAVVMLLSWTNVVLASRPGSCPVCHEIRPAYEQWSISTHKGIGCLNCHVEPTLSGYIKINVSAVVNTIKHVSGDYEVPVRAHVEDSSCVKCHPKDSRPEELPQASLRIAHSRHEEQRCADCHGRLVHRDIVAERPVESLAKSHAPKDCQVCHPSPKPEYVHGNASLACTSCHSANIPKHDLAVGQGIMPRESCQECHSRLRVVGSPEECQRCHISPHGIDQRVNLKCTLCHASAETWTVRDVKHPLDLSGRHADVPCSQCHTPSRPVKMTGGRDADCSACHQAKHAPMGSNKCSSCHSVQGWKSGHVDHLSFWSGYVGKHATAACSQCHLQSGKWQKPDPACASCHRPPTKHFGNDCAQCHKAGGRFKMSGGG